MADTMKAIGKLLVFDIIPSTGDISTDVVNSLNMLGYNATYEILQSINFTGLDSLVGQTENVYRVDEIWGTIGMCLIFMPGIFAFFYGIHLAYTETKELIQCKEGCFSILFWIVLFSFLLCFPVSMILVQVGILICCPKSKDAKDMLMNMIAFEAFFESSPQIHLQIFALIYGYKLTTIQVLSICWSFLLLAKTAVVFDLIDESVNSKTKALDWKQSARLIFTLLPAYVTSLVFKIGSTSIQMAFFRGWSSIPIGLQVLQMAVMGITVGIPRGSLLFLVASNMSVMNVCTGDGLMKNRRKFINRRKFVRFSSAITYMTSSIGLITILVLTHTIPTFLPHWPHLHLHGIYLTFAVIFLIAIGASNLGHQQMWNTKLKEMEE